jgi:2-iminobutanoate/2-iminopropanoate deaminase
MTDHEIVSPHFWKWILYVPVSGRRFRARLETNRRPRSSPGGWREPFVSQIGKGAEMTAELFNPKGLPPPGSGTYSHVARVAAGSELYFLAGQIGKRLDGTMAGSMEEQADCVFNNIRIILENTGLKPANLIKVQIFLTEAENRKIMHEAMHRILGDIKPVSTILVVKSLARPHMLIEVEAVAAR